MRPRLVLVAALCLACAATAAVAVVLDASRKPAPEAAAEFTFPQTVPSLELTPAADQTDGDDEQVPVIVQPSPSATSLSATSAAPITTVNTTSKPPQQASPTATRTTTAAPQPSKTTPTPPVAFVVGSTVGLAAVDRTGERVRHDNYRGRLDRIGSTSSDRDRSDSNFRVRSGLAGDGCVSFESVNFPGYYLRHYNFEIRLSRIDRTQLFREDATFCPVTIRDGAAVALRSTNYPSHHLIADGDRLKIVETSAVRALALKPQPAL